MIARMIRDTVFRSSRKSSAWLRHNAGTVGRPFALQHLATFAAFTAAASSSVLPQEPSPLALLIRQHLGGGQTMDGIIYLVGLIVIIMFILSLFGLR
jgi:hypothetical protein